MTLLIRARLEKALTDHGFDLTPTMEDNWLVGRSTQHSVAAKVLQNSDGRIALASDDADLRNAMALEPDIRINSATVGPTWQIDCPDYDSFYRTLGRFAVLARSLPSRVVERFAKATAKMPKTTEAERLVVQRVGQGLFREALIDYWQGRCAVTGLDVLPLLRASHIKPWAACDIVEERLDVFNGLLLAPHLDALFDNGWITFNENGLIKYSVQLKPESAALLGICSDMKINGLNAMHLCYLEAHWELVFRK